MRIRNESPYGDLDVPLLRAVVGAGEAVDVTDDHAEVLLTQADTWAPADDEAQAVADRLHGQAVEAERQALGIPSPAALKAEWVAYAEQQGDADAASKTKDQLIAEHGGVPSEEQDQ